MEEDLSLEKCVERCIKKFGLPIVVKADWLMEGKGVFICHTKEEAIEKIKYLKEWKKKRNDEKHINHNSL